MEPSIISTNITIEEYSANANSRLSLQQLKLILGYIIFQQEVLIEDVANFLQIDSNIIYSELENLLANGYIEGEFVERKFFYILLNFHTSPDITNLDLEDKLLLGFLVATKNVKIKQVASLFQIDQQQVLEKICRFLVEGYILEVEEITPKQYIFSYATNTTTNLEVYELSDDDIFIIGYLKMKRKITVNVTAIALGLPKYELTTRLIDLLLNRIILFRFEIPRALLGTDDLIIYHQKILVHKNLFTLDVLPNKKRLIIGAVGLLRTVGLPQLAEKVNITTETLLRKLAEISFETDYSFVITDNNLVLPTEEFSFPPMKSLDDLDKLSLFNYKALVGIIESEKKISINVLAKKMNTHTNEIFKRLVDLYSYGIIEGQIKKNAYIRKKGQRNAGDDSFLTFSSNERVILGALIAKGKLTWMEIGALLNIDRETAIERAFSFVSASYGIAQIVDDKQLKLTSRPHLPPLLQIADLSEQQQYIIGYLTLRNHVKMKELQNLLNVPERHIFQLVYDIVGSGLLTINVKNKKINVERVRIESPLFPIHELPALPQVIAKEIEKADTTKININKIVIGWKVAPTEILRQICYLTAFGYIYGELKKHTLTLKQIYNTPKVALRCLNCNSLLAPNSNVCPHCMIKQPNCMICRGRLQSSEQLVMCPNCLSVAHEMHLIEWLKVRNECPVCRAPLFASELKYLPR